MLAFKFVHYLKKATTYRVQIEHIDGLEAGEFTTDTSIVSTMAAESQINGVELNINVCYEPFTIYDSRGVLKLTSPEGMEYSCLLHGKAYAPQRDVETINLVSRVRESVSKVIMIKNFTR